LERGGWSVIGRGLADLPERTTALGASGFTVGALLVVVWHTCQTTTNNAPTATLQR